jgi:hypothetical protein
MSSTTIKYIFYFHVSLEIIFREHSSYMSIARYSNELVTIAQNLFGRKNSNDKWIVQGQMNIIIIIHGFECVILNSKKNKAECLQK